MEFEVDEQFHDILAFVEVTKLGSDDDVDKRLFRSVVAVDGDKVTINVTEDGSIYLSGSKTNENITKFWHDEMLDTNQIGNPNYMNDWLQEEIRRHPSNLYGAYISSWDYAIRLINADNKDLSPAIQAQLLIDEMESGNPYLANHNVAKPLLEQVKECGDVSLFALSDFTSHMSPQSITNR